jgi:hypothetical protein
MILKVPPSDSPVIPILEGSTSSLALRWSPSFTKSHTCTCPSLSIVRTKRPNKFEVWHGHKIEENHTERTRLKEQSPEVNIITEVLIQIV